MRRRLSTLLLAVASAAASGTVALAIQTLSPQPALAWENGLARTPPMGSNNWNFTHCDPIFNETTIKKIADAYVSLGLRDAGYQYLNIDDCWAEPSRDSSGNLVPNHTRFPGGIKALADYVHGKGLKFGIYTSAGTKTCNTMGFPAASATSSRTPPCSPHGVSTT
jgi:alpha-galactosidase